MNEEEKKKFLIPRQISKEIHIWRFVTFKEALFLALGGLIGYFLYTYIIPSGTTNQMKIFIISLPPTCIGLFLFVKPIKVRKSVRLFHVLKWKIDFNNRQTVFYYKKNGCKG